MAYDIILMHRDKNTELFAKKLGFNIIFQEDIKALKIQQIQDYNKKRQAVERLQINVLLNPHLSNLKDSLHYRRSGLDQVLCNFMHKNNIAMGFTLDSLNNHIDIGRVMQNIFLCRKYKVKILFFTFAKDIYGLRSRYDLISFLQVLGMTSNDANYALNGISEFLPEKP